MESNIMQGESFVNKIHKGCTLWWPSDIPTTPCKKAFTPLFSPHFSYH